MYTLLLAKLAFMMGCIEPGSSFSVVTLKVLSGIFISYRFKFPSFP